MHAPGPIEPKRSKKARPWELSIAAPAESEGGSPPSEGRRSGGRDGRAPRQKRNDGLPSQRGHGLLVHSVLSAQTGLALRLVWKNMGFPTTRRDFDHFAKMLTQTALGQAEDTLSDVLRMVAAKDE
jgi:hypothetical protein